MFDINYADGMSRPDTTISVFDSSGALIFVSRSSNIADDQPTPTKGADTANLAAGSFGPNDPFIGPVQLPEGAKRTYYVAVSSNGQLPSVLDATFQAAATDPLLRLEPVDSIKRVVDDPDRNGRRRNCCRRQRKADFSRKRDRPTEHVRDAFFAGRRGALHEHSRAKTGTLSTVNPKTGQQETTIHYEADRKSGRHRHA